MCSRPSSVRVSMHQKGSCPSMMRPSTRGDRSTSGESEPMASSIWSGAPASRCAPSPILLRARAEWEVFLKSLYRGVGRLG